MSRPFLDETKYHAKIKNVIAENSYQDTIDEVERALLSHAVVVVGMKQNPFCKKVRKNLDAANIKYTYLEYGSYFNNWDRRLALKMWSGWTTFPMVFVQGQLIGGNQDVVDLIESGELQTLLESKAQG